MMMIIKLRQNLVHTNLGFSKHEARFPYAYGWCQMLSGAYATSYTFASQWIRREW